MSDEIDTTPEARWKYLRESGPKVLVDLSSDDLIGEKPAWLDEGRFARAKKTIHKYYICVQYASLTGLMLVLQLPDALESLLATGNSKNIPSLFRRYMNTVIHVMSWYDDDIFDPNTKGYRSIRQVRSMHKRIQTVMNDHYHTKNSEGKEHLWVTQYDMAITQFAFIGLAILYPRKTGMIAGKQEDLELINYYWRVLGYLLGIKDEFNLCHFDNYDDIFQFNRLIFDHEYLEKFKEKPCPMGLEMSKALCKALQYYLPFVTFNSLAHWWSDCFSFNGYQLQPKSSKDRLYLLITEIAFYNTLRSRTILKVSNIWQRKLFDRRLLERERVHKKLANRYESCPFFHSDRMNYLEKPVKRTQTNVNELEQHSTNKSSDCETYESEIRQQTLVLASETSKGCFTSNASNKLQPAEMEAN